MPNFWSLFNITEKAVVYESIPRWLVVETLMKERASKEFFY